MPSPKQQFKTAELALQTGRFAPGAPVALVPIRAVGGNVCIGGFLSRAMYDVAPDGRFLMVVTSDDTVPSPITVVLNWQSALAARERR
jgi:hypothetical protein